MLLLFLLEGDKMKAMCLLLLLWKLIQFGSHQQRQQQQQQQIALIIA